MQITQLYVLKRDNRHLISPIFFGRLFLEEDFQHRVFLSFPKKKKMEEVKLALFIQVSNFTERQIFPLHDRHHAGPGRQSQRDPVETL